MMERVYIWDDGEVKERLAAEAEAYARLEFDWGVESDEESDEDSEDDDEDDDASDEEEDEEGSETDSEGGRRSKRRKLRADGDGNSVSLDALQ